MQYSLTPILWDNPANMYFEGPTVPVGNAVIETANAKPPAVQPDQSDQKAQAQGIVGFEQWLKTNFPAVYQGVIMSRPDVFIPELALAGMRGRGLRGLGQDPTTPSTDWGKVVSDIIKNVTDALPVIAQYQGQRDLIDLNITRAEKGLPMVSGGEIAPQVNVGIAPQTLMVFGAVAVGLLFVMSKKRR